MEKSKTASQPNWNFNICSICDQNTFYARLLQIFHQSVGLLGDRDGPETRWFKVVCIMCAELVYLPRWLVKMVNPDGWLLWQFPQTMRNSKLLELALVCWIFLIIYFLVHLLTRSSTCLSILTNRFCAHDNQIGKIAFTLPSCPNNSIYSTCRRTLFNHLLGLWGRRPQYVNFCCKLNIAFLPLSLRFSRA